MISLFETTEAEVAFDEAVLEAETDQFVFANESVEMFSEADEAGKASVWAKLKKWIATMGQKLKDLLNKIGDFFKSSFAKSKELVGRVTGAKKQDPKVTAEVEIDEAAEALPVADAEPGKFKKAVNATKHAVKVSWDWVLARLKAFGKKINSINPFKKHADKNIKDGQSAANKQGADGKEPGKIKSAITAAMGGLSKAISAVKTWIQNTFKAVTALFHKKNNSAEKASKDENRSAHKAATAK